MKSTAGLSTSKKPKPNDVFAIPDAIWPDESVVTEILSSLVLEKPQAQPARATVNTEVTTDYFRVLLSVANNAWQARKEIQNSQAGEIREDMMRLERHIEAIYQSLAQFGIAIRDHTGEAYEEGQPVRVIATHPTAGLDRNLIRETLLPSVFWNDRLIQSADVEIATPLQGDVSATYTVQ